MEVSDLLSTIEHDINRGVYTNFKVLSVRFAKIVKRLTWMKLVVNADELTHIERKLLIENGYITSQTVITNTKK